MKKFLCLFFAVALALTSLVVSAAPSDNSVKVETAEDGDTVIILPEDVFDDDVYIDDSAVTSEELDTTEADTTAGDTTEEDKDGNPAPVVIGIIAVLVVIAAIAFGVIKAKKK